MADRICTTNAHPIGCDCWTTDGTSVRIETGGAS